MNWLSGLSALLMFVCFLVATDDMMKNQKIKNICGYLMFFFAVLMYLTYNP